ncbi:HD-GYP domain-containing protein, partial [Agrobacterium sp. Azo12]|uniref:HD-GYP domain-containing protein n=1 Tax=Agrobacterium sp. Azo12 TaxID=3031129 RepID=UPI0026E039F6
APLHDVGKIGISDSVLLKPGRLTPEEITEMRRHVEIGVQILEKGTSDLVRIAEAVAGGHHEKWDGTGYPKGITGENIPIEARIVAIADVFEALCSERPYKRAWPIEEARDHIIAQSGLHFDPACVTAFENQWSRIASLMAQDLPKTIVDVPSLETPDEPAGPNQTVSEKPAPIRETSNVK